MILFMNPDSTEKTQYLQDLYKQGFVPGPNECFDTFIKRVETVQSLMNAPKSFLEKFKIPFETFTPITPYFLTITTKKGLPFWFGAMTLICEFEGQKIPIIELPKKKRGINLSVEELIAHEKIHYLRAAFNEPKFEEILAYQTSKAKWRKFAGPLFQNAWESYFCISLFILLSISPLVPNIFMHGISILTGCTLLAAISRLLRNQSLFKKAVKHLSTRFQNSLEIITLFSDAEIITTAKGGYEKIDKTSLRWQLIEAIAL